MTPATPSSPSKKPSQGFLAGLILGLGMTLVISCLGGAVGLSALAHARKKASAGWNLVPVIVASIDMNEGETVTLEKLSQRSVPEQFVTNSVVKPDSAFYVVGKKLRVPVQSGDLFLWSHVNEADAVDVLVAKRDIPMGETLADADAEERQVRKDLVTASWIRPGELAHAIGRPLIAPFRKGDPLLWTHVKPEGLSPVGGK